MHCTTDDDARSFQLHGNYTYSSIIRLFTAKLYFQYTFLKKILEKKLQTISMSNIIVMEAKTHLHNNHSYINKYI